MSARKMTADRLLGVIQHELGAAAAWSTEHLQEDQVKNLQYYLGMPLGNEIKGRSSVVSWDVFEVVESAMPGFIEPFFSGDTIGKFEPRGPEDEAYSDQATDYVNHIIKQRNSGFLLFNTWIKDSLLSKVGVVRGEWQEEPPKRRRFSGLTDEQMTMLAQDSSAELVAHREYPVPGMPPMNPAQMVQAGGRVPMLHDVEIMAPQPGCVKLENVRPENFVLTSGIGSLDKARVIGEWAVFTRSDLVQLGIRQARTVQSYDMASAVLDGRLDQVRDETAMELALADGAADESTEEIRLFKGFVRADWDGDGIAEWRRVLVGGGDDPILENEEADTHNYCVISPILIPHRVIGVAYADAARPLHEIKTTLTRQYLDSLYLANRPRTYVNMDAGVSLDDVLNERIGGIIRGRGPAANAVTPIQTAAVSRDALEGLQVADNMRETRLGIPKYNPGLESDALHKTATGVRSVNNLVDKRQKMTLRCLAETGIKDLFRLVLRLVTEYQDVPAIVRLRGQFVPFDPRGWSPDLDVVIEVGVGTSDETETMMLLQQIGQYMGWAQQAGVVQPRNVYEFGRMLIKNARLKGGDQRLLTDPRTLPPAQPQPDPKMAVERFKAQQDAMRFQAEAQQEQQRREAEARMQMATDQNRQEMEARQKHLELQQAAQIEKMRQESAERTEQQRLAFEQWKVEFQAQHHLALEQTRQSAQAAPSVDLAPLVRQMQELAEYVMAPSVIERDPSTGRVAAVAKGGRRLTVQRGPDGRAAGLAVNGTPPNVQ